MKRTVERSQFFAMLEYMRPRTKLFAHVPQYILGGGGREGGREDRRETGAPTATATSKRA